MSLSIDYATFIISVPQSYLTHVSGNLYELDLNQFHLDLKDLEDEADGMPFPDTHRHTPPVTVAGVTIARVVEILAPYTVEFENGMYGVNLIGANSNVADVTVVNSVGLRVFNTAGLTEPGEGATPDQMWDLPDGVETGLTPRQALRLAAAVLAGKISGAPTGPIVIRSAVADDKERVTATVDASGNRTDVSTDVT